MKTSGSCDGSRTQGKSHNYVGIVDLRRTKTLHMASSRNFRVATNNHAVIYPVATGGILFRNGLIDKRV
jgi:hypothetical protein